MQIKKRTFNLLGVFISIKQLRVIRMDEWCNDNRYNEFKYRMRGNFPLRLYTDISALEDQKGYWDTFDYLEDKYQLSNEEVMDKIGFSSYPKVDPFSLYNLFIHFDFSVKSESYNLFGLSQDELIYYMIVGKEMDKGYWSSLELSEDIEDLLINKMIKQKCWYMQDDYGNKYKLYSNFHSNDSNCMIDAKTRFILLVSSPSPCGNRIIHLNPIESGKLYDALIEKHYHEISEKSFGLANLLLEKYSNHCLGIQNVVNYQLSGIFGQIIHGSKMINPMDTLTSLGLDKIIDVSVFDGLLQNYSESCEQFDIAQLTENHVKLSTLIKETIDFQMMSKFVQEFY